MFWQINNQYSRILIRKLLNLATRGLTGLANGTRGIIILPLAAVIALPQRIYYSCKRREILSNRFMDNGDNHVNRELRDLILAEEEIPLIQNYSKFLIQTRMRLPSEIFIFQDIYLLLSGFTFFISFFNDPLNRNFVNQLFFRDFTPSQALILTLSGVSFFASATKPKILWINLEYLKSTFKSLLNFKSVNRLDNLENILDKETGEYAALNFIAISAENLQQAKELIPYCPKTKLKSDFLSENTQTKQLILLKMVLKEMLAPPIIEIIQDYYELPAICNAYKNAIKFSSDTIIQMPPNAQDVFENVVKTRKKGKIHHI